jgi:hypothetical protein
MTKLEKQLIEIFKAVADACDGSFDDDAIEDIIEVYNKAMETKVIEKLYNDLIDNNPLNELIE